MRGLQIEAVYAGGVLKLPRELPLEEGQTVTITIHPPSGVAERGHGRKGTGLTPEEPERAGLDPRAGKVGESSEAAPGRLWAGRGSVGVALRGREDGARWAWSGYENEMWICGPTDRHLSSL